MATFTKPAAAATLSELADSAGRSLARAQEQLVRAGETGAASMMMSEVTLEIRAALTSGAGELGVEPVSLARLSAGLPQDGLSTLKLR